MEHERNILDHLGVVIRWRRMILICVLGVSLVTAGVSLILPKAYRASAVVYPPKEAQDMFGLSALLGDLPMGLLGMGESAISATDFVPVLESDRVADAIAGRYGLMARYEAETREDLLLMIEDRLDVDLSREQYLTVSYEDETPELAAEITNAFVEELDRALQERRVEQSRSLRDYLDRRLVEAKDDMLDAERAYNQFQQRHMAIDLETQAKAQIDGASEMFSAFAELYVKREIAAKRMTPGHPKLRQLDLDIAGARKALDELLMGRSAGDRAQAEPGNALPDIFIPFREVPEIGLEALQLMRDVEIHNAIYTFVRQEYEKARFEEEKETPLVIVLDQALPPDYRSRPRRTMMVAVAGGLSLAVSLLLAFLLEALAGLEGDNRRKLDSILSDLRPRGSD
ncbi:MAG: GNVR domain-containing protein [Candidatus Latescibacteria bacterium]|jgi:uncharacterized protein involved in exopolysaccharide biosynthesis|nr:GNVR domain-containing protein [Candidatus Latescibacterota bacterium]